MIDDIKKDITRLDVTNRSLRHFGYLLAGICLLGTAILLWKGKSTWLPVAGAGMLFSVVAARVPATLRQPYRLWMLLAFMLGWITTRIVLTLAYLLIMTPMGLFLRILGKDVLDARIDKAATSYWKKHEPVPDRKQYQKQY